MKRLSIFTVVLLGAALTACHDVSEQVAPVKGDEIRFSTSIGEYATKATDTAFEDGDVVGLYALEPINVSGVKLTWKGGAFTPEEPLYWGRTQTEATQFLAWYPYDISTAAAFNPTEPMQLSINPDQSKAAVYAAQDLLGAVTSAKPGETVHLAFKHLLSKLTLQIESALEIADVRVEGLLDGYTVDLANNRVAGFQSPVMVVYTPFYAGNNVWNAITVPTTTALRVIIYTKDQRELAYSSGNLLNFESGKQVVATLSIKDDETVSFTSEIIPWNEGATISMGEEPPQPEVESFSLYLNDEAQTVIPLEYLGAGHYQTVVNLAKEDGSVSGFYIANEDGSKFFAAKETNYFSNEVWTATDANPYYYHTPRIVYGQGTFHIELDLSTRSVRASEFQSIGWGSMLEGNVTTLFGLPAAEWPVEYAQPIDGGEVYQVRSPYHMWDYNSYFELEDRGVIIDARDPEAVYIAAESHAGLMYQGGSILTESYDKVNGWNMEGGTGTLVDGEITFPVQRFATYLPGQGWYLGNRYGHTTFVLPGYQRHTYYVSDLGDISYTPATTEDGTKVCRFTTTLYPDNTKLVMGVFEGYFTTTAELNAAVEQAKNLGEGFAEYPFDADIQTAIDIALPEIGKYRLLAYTEGADGTWYYRYLNFAYVPDGEEAPACEFTVSEPTLSEISPDTEAVITVTGDINSARVVAIPAEEADKLTEEELYNFVYNHGAFYRGNATFLAGYEIQVSGMNPDSDYLIAVWGMNAFGSETVQSVRVHTAAATEWVSVGRGTFIDRFVPCMWNLGGYDTQENYYISAVEILQDPAIEGKYRVMRPYAQLWETADETLAGYLGMAPAEYVDFYTVTDTDGQDYIFFSDFSTGFRYPSESMWTDDTAVTIIYHHGAYGTESPSTNQYAYQNRKIAEGVYQIAPYMQLYGTSYYLANYEVQLCCLVLMPGVEFDPIAAEEELYGDQAPRLRRGLNPGGTAARGMVKAVDTVSLETALRPADVSIRVYSDTNPGKISASAFTLEK